MFLRALPKEIFRKGGKMARVKKITLKGKIFSGGGTGSFFVNLPWARKQFREKLGFNPYPGTLNLQLPPETDVKELRNATKGIKIRSPEGFHEGRCFKALIMEKLWGAVVMPDVPEYPHDLLEILAPFNLRETLGLKDGMEIKVTVCLE
jgi:riboflavin kinase